MKTFSYEGDDLQAVHKRLQIYPALASEGALLPLFHHLGRSFLFVDLAAKCSLVRRQFPALALATLLASTLTAGALRAWNPWWPCRRFV